MVSKLPMVKKNDLPLGCVVTNRKSALPLPVRTPAYVSREVGAAELCISPETWDAMVARGELPPPDYKIGGTMPRWKWTTVESRLNGMCAIQGIVITVSRAS
jgi:hypothetical protein